LGSGTKTGYPFRFRFLSNAVPDPDPLVRCLTIFFVVYNTLDPFLKKRYTLIWCNKADQINYKK
jgi:hypothetical protein